MYHDDTITGKLPLFGSWIIPFKVRSHWEDPATVITDVRSQRLASKVKQIQDSSGGVTHWPQNVGIDLLRYSSKTLSKTLSKDCKDYKNLDHHMRIWNWVLNLTQYLLNPPPRILKWMVSPETWISVWGLRKRFIRCFLFLWSRQLAAHIVFLCVLETWHSTEWSARSEFTCWRLQRLWRRSWQPSTWTFRLRTIGKLW